MKIWQKITRGVMFCSLVAVLGLGLSAEAQTSVATVEAALGGGTGTYLDLGPSDSNGGITGTWANYAAGDWGYPDTSDSGVSVNGNCLDDKGNSTPEIQYTITGLSNSTVYTLWVVAVDPANDPGDADFSWGTTSGTLTRDIVSSGTVISPISGSTAGLNGVNVGAVTSDVNGAVTIYLGAGNAFSDPNNRTELDGVLLEPKIFGVLDFTLDNTTFRSDATISDLVGHINATLDGSPATNVYFQLISGAGDTDNGKFALSVDYTNLLVNSDFSTGYTNNQPFSVRIYGEDLGGSGVFATNTFTLTMQAATLETSLSKSYFYSGQSIGSPVGTLSSDVLGTSVSNTTYSLVAGTGDTDNGLFGIVGSDLVISNSFIGSVTNGQPFSVRIQSIGGGKTNETVLALTALLDDNLDGLLDSTHYVVNWQDDFSTNSVGDYIYSRLVSYSYVDPTITVTNGVLNFANQTQCKSMTVHKTKQLAVGQTVFLDLLTIPTASNARFGVLVCATNSLPTDSNRADMVYLATEADSDNRWNIGNYNGATGTGFTSGFSSWADVKSVYIQRTAVDSFTLGYVDTNLTLHDVATVSNTSMSNSCYVGIADEAYNTASCKVDNLRIEHLDIPYDSAFSGDGTKFASGDAIGTVLGTLSSTEYGAPVSSTYSFVGGYDNSRFSIDGDQLKLAADLTGSASTNGQVFTVQIMGQSDNSSSADTNLYTLTVIKDDNLDAIPDSWTQISANTFSSFSGSDWTTNNLLQQVSGTANYAASNSELRVTYPTQAGGGAIRTALLYQPATLDVGQVVVLDVDTANYTEGSTEERIGLVVSLSNNPGNDPVGTGIYTNVASICVRPGSGNLTRQVWDGSGVASEQYPALPSDLAHLYIYRKADDVLELGYIGTDLVSHPLDTETLADFTGKNAYYGIWSDARTATYDFGVDNLAVYTMTSTPTVGPVIGAALSSGSFIMSWTGGGTYSVMTNSDLTNPNGWGVMISGMSPITNAVGSEPNLFFKLQQ